MGLFSLFQKDQCQCGRHACGIQLADFNSNHIGNIGNTQRRKCQQKERLSMLLLSYFSWCVTKSTSAKLWSNWICVTWRRNGRVGILCNFQSWCIMSESCGLANMCYKRHQRCWYKILQTRSSTLNVVFVVIFHKI